MAWCEVPLGSSLVAMYKELYIKAEALSLGNREFSAHVMTGLMSWSLML